MTRVMTSAQKTRKQHGEWRVVCQPTTIYSRLLCCMTMAKVGHRLCGFCRGFRTSSILPILVHTYSQGQRATAKDLHTHDSDLQRPEGRCNSPPIFGD